MPDPLHTRIHPHTKPTHTVAPLPLVCIGSVAAPSPTALLLFRDGLRSQPFSEHNLTTLRSSLSLILTAYPQLTGRLRLALPNDEGRPYTKRYLRTWMEYGRDDDPGLQFSYETRAEPIDSILPLPVNDTNNLVSDVSPLNDRTLAPTLEVPLVAPGRGAGELPIAGVKITRFSCGSTALCFASSHTLFDAGALGTFLHDWATVHEALYRGHKPVVPSRPFDPVDLDSRAAGDLDSDAADAALVQAEAALDVMRYDSWARDPEGRNNPPTAQEAALGPAPEVDAQDAAQGRPRGTPPPWSTASPAAPTYTYSIKFGRRSVDKIYARAKAQVAGEKISHNDALVAHLWRLVARARGQSGETVLDCEMACDVRRLLAPPVPVTAPGQFNVCLGWQARAEQIVADEGGLGWGAVRVRRAIETVTPSVLAPWLHRRAHDLDPNREWIVFPGDTTVCITNWARSMLYDVDFGGGKPMGVHNLVQGFGGFATVLKSCHDGFIGKGKGEHRAEKWFEHGVEVVLWLEQGEMQRLLADPELMG